MIYAYTLNYKTGKVIERIGEFGARWTCGGKWWRFDELTPEGNRTGKYLTSLDKEPGVVHGSTIWFLEPNLNGAIEAFRNASRKISEEYDNKRSRSAFRADNGNIH